MLKDSNLKESLDVVNNNLENDVEMQKLRIELTKRFDEYQKTIAYMIADAPIQVLCLDIKVEKILLNQGFLRVYDLFNLDFLKIKGIGVSRVRHLTSRLDEFLSMI